MAERKSNFGRPTPSTRRASNGPWSVRRLKKKTAATSWPRGTQRRVRDEHPEDFPSRELAVEFVEDVKAKAKVSDGVAARGGRAARRTCRVCLRPSTSSAPTSRRPWPRPRGTQVPEDDAHQKPSGRKFEKAVVAAIRTVAAPCRAQGPTRLRASRPARRVLRRSHWSLRPSSTAASRWRTVPSCAWPSSATSRTLCGAAPGSSRSSRRRRTAARSWAS